MSQNIELNSKAVWTLDGLVCFTSAAIGAYWGGITFYIAGAIVGGIGGLFVAVGWCFIVRKMLFAGWDSLLIFILAGILGGIAGATDGVLLHLICFFVGSGKVFIKSTNLISNTGLGLIFGFFSGLANGAFWGSWYGSLAYAAEKRRLKGACNEC